MVGELETDESLQPWGPFSELTQLLSSHQASFANDVYATSPPYKETGDLVLEPNIQVTSLDTCLRAFAPPCAKQIGLRHLDY